MACCVSCALFHGMHRGTCPQVKGKLYPVDVYSVGPLRNNEGGIQADSASGRRGRKQRRAGTQGLAATSGPVALSGNRTRSTDTISKIKFKQMVGRQNEIQQVGSRFECQGTSFLSMLQA